MSTAQFGFCIFGLCPDCTVTHGAAGGGPAVEKRASHPDNLCLHLSYAWEDVWVKWIAPSKISINLRAQGKETHVKICITSKQFLMV